MTQRNFVKIGNWAVAESSMEAVVVATKEKHFLKYFVQHIEKYSEKQTKNESNMTKKELCDDWELDGD